MNQVTVQEVLDTLTDAVDLCLPEGEPYALTTYEVLRGRIEAHGIAPPDGMVLVSSDILAVQVECKCGRRHENRVSKFTAPSADELAAAFLGWKLPEDFFPDYGISFARNEWHDRHGMPTGTNLFHFGQAKAMFEYVLAAAKPEVAR